MPLKFNFFSGGGYDQSYGSSGQGGGYGQQGKMKLKVSLIFLSIKSTYFRGVTVLEIFVIGIYQVAKSHPPWRYLQYKSFACIH